MRPKRQPVNLGKLALTLLALTLLEAIPGWTWRA